MRDRRPVAHFAFLVAVFLKGLDGALELLAGFSIAITGPWRLYSYAIWTLAPELANKFGERAADVVERGAGALTRSSTFVVVYLLAHGALKLALAICLLRGGTWIFPVASAVLLGFVGYLSYHALVHESAWLAGFAAFDAVTLALVLTEWRNRATGHLGA